MLKISVPHARTCVSVMYQLKNINMCRAFHSNERMLGRVRVFQCGKKGRKQTRKRERERVSDVDTEREREEKEKEKTTRSGTNVKDFSPIGWCGCGGWLARRRERRVFSTSRGCLREKEEREYAGTGGGGEGSHPHGTPSYQVEVLGVGEDFGLRFSVRVCNFLLCLFFF